MWPKSIMVVLALCGRSRGGGLVECLPVMSEAVSVTADQGRWALVSAVPRETW